MTGPSTVHRAVASLALLAVVACAADPEGPAGPDGGPPPVTAPLVSDCGFRRGDPPPSSPVGHGFVSNLSLATLVDRPLPITPALIAEAVTIDDSCFEWSVTEVVEQPAGGTAAVDEAQVVTYTPATGRTGFYPFVVRVDFSRRDDPACADAEPAGEGFLHETTSGGGADLARIGVFVMTRSATLLAPCTAEDCVSVEVLDWAGERVPTFFLRAQEPDLDPENGCDARYWDLDGDVGVSDAYLLDNAGLRTPDHDSFDFSASGFLHELPTSPEEWLGACGFRPQAAGTVRTIVVRRADFEGYCAAVRHNDDAWSYRLPMPEDLAGRSSEGPALTRDWPVFSAAAPTPGTPTLAGDAEIVGDGGSLTEGYQSLDELRERLKKAEPQTLFDYVSKLLSYLHSDDDKYVRAVHYGTAWGDFETKLLALVAQNEKGTWADLSAPEQLTAVTELVLSFNNAMGDRWPRLRGWLEKLLEVQSTAQRIVSVYNGLVRIYGVFAVNPSDPMEVAEAFSAYLTLLAEITGKVAPPLGIYVTTLADGVKNTLPALRTIRDRTHQTNVAIDTWLADAETFAEEWQQFVRPEAAAPAPAFAPDAPDVATKYYEGWETDLLNLKRNTWREASRYEHAQKHYKRVAIELTSVPWSAQEAYLRQRYAADPTRLTYELDRLTERRATLSRDFSLLFHYRAESRVAFRNARAHYIALLRAARSGMPGAQRFLDDYEKTLLTEVGNHPWPSSR